MTPTQKTVTSARRYLTVKSIDKSGLDDNAIIALAVLHGWQEPNAPTAAPTAPPAPAQPATPTPTPTAPPVVAGGNIAAAIAEAIAAALSNNTPAIDEGAIIELIKAHSKPQAHTITVTTPTSTVTLTDEITHSAFDDCVREITCFPYQLFLYGATGSGKSYTAGQIARSLDMPFFSMGAILVKYDILGSMTKDTYIASTVRRWLESDTGLLCIDEIDSSCPRALVTIMSMFDDTGKITFPDKATFTRDASTHPIVVTANTTGNGGNHKYNGRAKLDAAFKARFIQLEHGYCDALENTFASEDCVDYVRRFRAALESKGLEGALVSPRHTKMLGVREALGLSKLTFARSLKLVLKQGLTDSEYSSIISTIGAF